MRTVIHDHDVRTSPYGVPAVCTSACRARTSRLVIAVRKLRDGGRIRRQAEDDIATALSAL